MNRETLPYPQEETEHDGEPHAERRHGEDEYDKNLKVQIKHAREEDEEKPIGPVAEREDWKALKRRLGIDDKSKKHPVN